VSINSRHARQDKTAEYVQVSKQQSLLFSRKENASSSSSLYVAIWILSGTSQARKELLKKSCIMEQERERERGCANGKREKERKEKKKENTKHKDLYACRNGELN